MKGWRVTSVALVGLALLGGAAWWTARTTPAAPVSAGQGPAGQGGAPVRATAPAGIASSPPATAAAGPAGSGSGTTAGLAVPSAPPAGVTWQVWRTIALPYSPAAGPARVQGSVAAGFARTPTGALLAAVHASSRKAAAGEGDWQDVGRSMLAPGTGRDAWLAARGRVQHPDAPQPGTFAQVAGFQFVSWTATDAVVQLASRTTDGSYGVVALHVSWLDGDWRLVLAPDGGDATSQQRATSLGGFVAWGGV